jgi:hypothetical protein
VEERIAQLKDEQRRLEIKLAKKKIEYEKLKIPFSELPFTSFWRKIFQRRLKRLLWEKEERLRKEVLELEQKTLKLEEQLALLQEKKE